MRVGGPSEERAETNCAVSLTGITGEAEAAVTPVVVEMPTLSAMIAILLSSLIVLPPADRWTPIGSQSMGHMALSIPPNGPVAGYAP